MTVSQSPAEQLLDRARRRMADLDERMIPTDVAERWTWATQAEVDDLLRERTTFSGDRVQLIQITGQGLRVFGLRVEIVDPRAKT